MIAAGVRLWDRLWFAPTDRYQIGIFRVFLLAWFGYYYATSPFLNMEYYASLPLEFLDLCFPARWLPLPVPYLASWIPPLRVAALTLVATSLVGLATRPSLIVLALLNLYLGGVRNSWGYTAHAAALPSLVLVVVACAPGVSTWSVDALIEAALARRRGAPVDLRRRLLGAPVPVWPARLILVLLAAVYFAAGVSKIRHGGWAWTDGRTLAFYLSGGSLRGERQYFTVRPGTREEEKWRDGFGLEGFANVARPTRLGLDLAKRQTVTRAVAILTVLFETTFPLALLGRPFLSLYLVAGLLFHLGVESTMRINFNAYLVCYLLFINWVGLARLLRPRPQRPSTFQVV